MDLRHRKLALGIACGLYLMLLASIFTPAFSVGSSAHNKVGLGLGTFVAAELGLGLAFRDRWALIFVGGMGAVVTIAAVVAYPSAAAYTLLFFIPGILVIVALVGIGWLFGNALGRFAPAGAAAAFLAAGILVAVASADSIERSNALHLSAAEQRSLPVYEYSLIGDICVKELYRNGYPSSQVQRFVEKLRTRGLHELEALKTALQDHPDSMVTAHYILADPRPGENRDRTEEMTVRELAEKQLSAPGLGNACERQAKDDLQNAIGAAR